MSKEALAKVVQRAISDAGFRRQLNSDPAGALRGFDLSADEMSALRAGDAGRLSTLGVDQRMSKAFTIGGAVGATRMAQSDLSAGNATMVDDASGLGSRTVIPTDPTRAGGSADATGGAEGTNTVRAGDDYKFAGRSADASGGAGGTNTVRAGDDYKFAGRQSPEGTGAGRTGDDWKYADRSTGQAGAAPVEGSPEADAAAQAASGDGRIGTARLDDASGSSSGASAINDDPDGFLAANANADMSGSVTRANAIHDDPDGFLAANANADVSGGTTGGGTAFLDDSEAYLTKVGYDSSPAGSAVTDAHDRGDATADSSLDDDGGAGGNASSDHGPHLSS